MGDVDSALAWLEIERSGCHPCSTCTCRARTGIRSSQEYRARRAAGASVPVIAVSAYAPELVDPGAAILFFDYLLKPVRYEVLKSAVARAVSVTRRE